MTDPRPPLTYAEAAEALGVTTDTVSAYVGRGLLSASEDTTDRRRKLIPAADVAALVARHAQRPALLNGGAS